MTRQQNPTGPLGVETSSEQSPMSTATLTAPLDLASEGPADSPSTELSIGRRRRSRVLHRLKQIGYWLLVVPYQIICLILLLGVLCSIPIMQLPAFGYLLDISGSIARAKTIRVGLSKLNEASLLVTAGFAVYLASLPTLLYGSYFASANWISPDNPVAEEMRQRGIIWASIAMIYLLWCWARGGRIRDYLWPAPIRFLKEGWRPSFWTAAFDRLWPFIKRLEIIRYSWLGLRGLVGTLIWIGIPALLLIGATRGGETGLAGLVGFIGIVLMGVVLIYLPFLQVQFACDDRFKAMFEVRRVRQSFRRSPFLFWLALVMTLLLAMPPYLLKAEAVPREFVWLIATIVIAFVIPGRLMTGWALARAQVQTKTEGIWRRLWRWLMRFACLPVVAFYLMIVYATQFTSWHGLATWIQQHAVSIPAPFVGT